MRDVAASRKRSDGFSIVTIVFGGTLLVTETPAPITACANDRLASQDRGVRVDHDVAFDRGVTFRAADQVAVGIVLEADRTESDALVKLNVVGDLAGFSDHHARAVVDEKTRPDPGSRMNINAGAAVRHSVIIRGMSGTRSICRPCARR